MVPLAEEIWESWDICRLKNHNKALNREVNAAYMEEVNVKLEGAKVFSILDASS